MKNYATIISLLYNYGSVTGDFLESFVGWLSARLDKNSIELLYIIIQKCGIRVRQNDPSALKSIISIIKESISRYRASHVDG
jgi:nucleolar MIF4G domain-containing protein 1